MHLLLQPPLDAALIMQKKRRIKRELLAQKLDIELRLAVLGGSTTTDLISVLELFLLDIGIKPIFYEADYGKWYETACFGTPALDAFQPQLIYIHTTCADLSWPPAKADAKKREEMANSIYLRYQAAWQALAARYKCPIVQNNFEEPYKRYFGSLDALQGTTAFVAALNSRFVAYAAAQQSFLLHDIHYLASFLGLANWHDPEQYHLYKLAPCHAALPYLAQSLAALIGSSLGRSRKCLVLDLDNTLWGGVIGDDGLGGIQLGHETAAGEGYAEFQTYVKGLASRGVALAVCSKNEEAIAKEGFSHPDSVLHLEDFAAFIANWEPKPMNIRQLAQQINLGLDSLVFIDDNPAERELVRQALPEVAVPEVEGGHPASYMLALEEGRYFEMASFTADDRQRTAQYTANRERTALQAEYASYSEFLQGLEMQAEIAPFCAIYMDRITQLTNKTNQFNLTTCRYTRPELEQAAAVPGTIALYGRLADKFGENGLVTVVMAQRAGQTLTIDLWLMSCRVLKRGLEYAMFAELLKRAVAQGVQEIVGIYYPTAKNAMVRGFYGELGFQRDGAIGQDGERWLFRIGTDHCEQEYYMAINAASTDEK